MELKVILLTLFEGRKRVILIHNSMYITLVPHKSLMHHDSQKWYFVTKIVLTYCEKKYSSNREKLLKIEAEGREFANISDRSLEQFIQTVKGQNNFW